MADQSNANFKSNIEAISQPYSDPVVVVDELAKNSALLDFMFKTRQGDAPLTGLETFNNRYKKFAVNNYYPYTQSTLPDMMIQYGDTKNAVSGKHLIDGEITAADFGHTQGITLEDMQRLQGYTGKMAWVNWYEAEWKKLMQAWAINITNSIYNGTGTVTRTDLATRNDFVGLHTAIGSATYAGINYATDNVPQWQSQGTITTYSNWDMTSVSTIFGMTVASSFDTLAHATAVPTGGTTTPAWDLLSNAVRRCQISANDKSKYIIIVPPWFYDFCFIPSLKAMASTNTFYADKVASETEIVGWGNVKTPYTIHGVPVLAEDCSMVTSQYGSTPSFLFPANSILILNMSSVHLGVNPTANFKVSPWIDIQTQYEVMQRSFNATLAMWIDDRWSNGKITLPAALVTAGKAVYGIA